MEDAQYLSAEDKAKLESLKRELAELKAEHKSFASRKSKITPEDREKWRANSQRMDQVHVELKELRFKNVMEAGR